MSETEKVLARIREDRAVKAGLSRDGTETPETEKVLERIKARKSKESSTQLKGLATEAAEGLTLGLYGEISSALRAQKSGDPYAVEKAQYEIERQRFLQSGTALSQLGLPAEILASIPTGAGVFAGLGRSGIKSVAKRSAFEGGFYGGAQGDTFEERAQSAFIGASAGLALGKLVDVSSNAWVNRNKKTVDSADSPDGVPEQLEFDGMGADEYAVLKTAQEAKDDMVFTEVDNPAYRTKPLKDAQTVGEFYQGVKDAVRRFYNEKITGTSDALYNEVGPQVSFGFQRADQGAQFTTGAALDKFAKNLMPVIKKVSTNEKVHGALLDYGAGTMVKRAAGETFESYRNRSLDQLREELAEELSQSEFNNLKAYILWSEKKNMQANREIFGLLRPIEKTYLHSRVTKEIRQAKKQQLKDQGLDDAQIERLLVDDGFQARDRGRYLDPTDPSRPNPLDYDNILLADMQRNLQIEKMYQLKRVFGVDTKKVNEAAEFYGRPLTPMEFMDELEARLRDKGISQRGAQYSRERMVESMLSDRMAPHPVIQALSSLAYASTLAGPMSAILNLADAPLVGAKYGGPSARAAMKSVVQDLTPPVLKKPAQLDLERMGLNNQRFGEFTGAIEREMANPQGFLEKTAAAFRQGADMLMVGSGFAALDVVGKRGVMRGVLKSAADDAAEGSLAKNWSFYFDERELDLISKQLTKHGDDFTKYTGEGKELIEELMFAGLGQQQLISSAGRPAAWHRNPNLRPLWALRGFVVKQQALAMREVVGNLKAGKPEEAAKFLGRYAAYGAGGYAVINEGRQAIFGDGDVSANGLLRGYGDAWASLLTLNTLGLNDYQYGQIKQNGFLLTMADGLLPIALTRPLEIGKSVIDAIDRKRPIQAPFVEASPLIKQTARFIRNVSPENSITRDLSDDFLVYRLDDED